MSSQTLLQVDGLRTSFDVKRAGKTYELKAVDNVTFDLRKGEILGFVGETGCGKTTVGRSLIGLTRARAGTVTYDNKNLLALSNAQLRDIRSKIRMVFQDPFASLNPRRNIGDSVAESGDIHGIFKDAANRGSRVSEAMRNVGLDPSFADRFPHELSGGQRQRVGIARAILPSPEIIIADEPVSALDVSIQAQVLNLLMDLREQLHLTIMFISHDLSVVGQISDRIAVMYLGRIVEIGDAESVFAEPRHPYTQALVDAVPKPDPRIRIGRELAKGEPPSRFEPPPGCSFADRCPLVMDRCRSQQPDLKVLADGRKAACHAID
jgi:oligopeptide/dipeptide ABC transporter ATP-binding protein